jgi:hypothetical protein
VIDAYSPKSLTGSGNAHDTFPVARAMAPRRLRRGYLRCALAVERQSSYMIGVTAAPRGAALVVF